MRAIKFLTKQGYKLLFGIHLHSLGRSGYSSDALMQKNEIKLNSGSLLERVIVSCFISARLHKLHRLIMFIALMDSIITKGQLGRMQKKTVA
jgi:hypothetical protein